MIQELKILMLEDSEVDAELIQRLLKNHFACSFKVCSDEAEFRRSLNEFFPDVILADNSILHFSASDALHHTRKNALYTPFIMVTGTVSEEFAAEIIKKGADDYLLKDRLHRLPSAIESAIKQRATEKENEAARLQLIESEKKYRSIFENSPLPILVYDIDTLLFLDVNQRAVEHYGYSKEEFLQMDITSIRPQDELERFLKEKALKGAGAKEMGKWRHLKKGGTEIIVRIFSHDVNYNNIPARMVIAEDITEKIVAEKALKELESEFSRQKIQEQKKISRAIIEVQEQERNRLGQELHDNITQILASTKMFMTMAGRKSQELGELIRYPLELVDSAIQELRLLSARQVTPLKNVNLQELIVKLIDGLGEGYSIEVNFQFELNENLIGDNLKLNIYRIIQELVNNIIKHSQATRIELSLLMLNDNICISMRDNGKGFDEKQPMKGIGISNMQNRVESFNGCMKMSSLPGKGTQMEVCIPLSLES